MAVENSVLEKNILPKSISDANILENNKNNKVCAETQCDCNDTTNFSTAFENLGFEIQSKNMPQTPRLKKDIQPCLCADCLRQENKIIRYRTREISSLKLVIQGPEILNHQGIQHNPDDIAPYWKKDSRMWLWKSVRLARKQKNKSKSLTSFATLARVFGVQ